MVGNTYIYKDEKTGQVLEWNLEAKEWRAKDTSTGIATSRPPKIKRHNSDEEFDSDDSAEEKLLEQKKADINHHVTVLSNGVKTYTDPADGTVFEWDEDKKAWFPKLDDEFIARYQLSYGSNTVDTQTELEKKVAPVPSKSAGEEKKKESEQPTWFEVDETKNTKVGYLY
jgi:HIV Tat-specific factor 1